MFDKETRILIESSPKLKNLNLEELSDDLSRLFTNIIALRTQGFSNLELNNVNEEIKRLSRLANTYEAFLLSIDNHPLKDSSAFVSATAYSFINSYEKDRKDLTKTEISDSDVSTAVSSMLLFFISGYFTDAQSIAKTLNLNKNTGIKKVVLTALILLVNGNFSKLENLNSPDLDIEKEDLFEIASKELWGRIIKFIQSLGRKLKGEEILGIEEEIELIIGDCVLEFGIENDKNSSYYIFRGQFHIAKLLKACIGPLNSSSISLISPPNGVNETIWASFVKNLSLRRPFLWKNHVEAIEKGILNIGTSAVISFPTGAGKSTLSELKIGSTLATKKSIIFLAPTNSLINQVIRDLKIAFPKNKIRRSISNTGEYSHVDLPSDIKKSDISVMTPEKCLTQLRQNPEAFVNVGLLIFDECHLIHCSSGKKSRNIDSMLGLLYFMEVCPESDILLISAMIDNVEDLSIWLQSQFNKTTLPLKIEWKPTRQVRGCVVYNKNDINDILIKTKLTSQSSKPKPVDRDKDLLIQPYAHFSLQQQWSKISSKKKYSVTNISSSKVSLALTNNSLSLTSNKVKVATSIAINFASKGIKTLLFLQNPLWAKSVATESGKCAELIAIEYTDEERNWIEQAALEIGSRDYLHLPINKKTAYHFGDMLEFERNIAESCFSRTNGLFLLAATNTLAQGLNLPAEAVIIVGNDRYDGERNKNLVLDAHELLNAAGRAGRAGFVSQGIVLVIPSEVVSFKIDKENFILSGYWNKLRDSVFSKADNCLTVVDPLTTILDKIQIDTELELNNILYLIQRLPFEKSEDSLKDFIGKSFGAYQAKKQGKSITPLLDKLIEFRQEAQVTEGELIWLVSVSYKYGVEFKLVASLNEYLSKQDLFAERNISEWIDLFFKWLYEEPEIVKSLFNRTDIIDFFSAKKENKTEGDVLDLLQKAIGLWISGENYLEASKLLSLELKSNLSIELGTCLIE